jgi:anti-anti-sigma factor
VRSQLRAGRRSSGNGQSANVRPGWRLSPQKGFHRLIVDLRGMTFIDSTGLGVIVDLWKRSREERFDLELVRGPETIQRAFKLAGLEELIHTVDDSSPH